MKTLSWQRVKTMNGLERLKELGAPDIIIRKEEDPLQDILERYKKRYKCLPVITKWENKDNKNISYCDRNCERCKHPKYRDCSIVNDVNILNTVIAQRTNHDATV